VSDSAGSDPYRAVIFVRQRVVSYACDSHIRRTVIRLYFLVTIEKIFVNISIKKKLSITDTCQEGEKASKKYDVVEKNQKKIQRLDKIPQGCDVIIENALDNHRFDAAF